MLLRTESTGCQARLPGRPERFDRNKRIDRKTQLLERLDPEREAKLEGTFTNHVADAIRAGGPRERQQEIDDATEAYEAALDGVLHEILDEGFAEEDSGAA
jgi:hypothetical protein